MFAEHLPEKENIFIQKNFREKKNEPLNHFDDPIVFAELHKSYNFVEHFYTY